MSISEFIFNKFTISAAFFTLVLLGKGVAQIEPPAGIGDSSNIIMWLHPDTAVFNSSGDPISQGETVYEWHDISGNDFVFENTRNNRRPTYNQFEQENYLDFSRGDILFNTQIADSINGLTEFSIFVVIKSDDINTDQGFLYWKYPPDGDDDGLCLRYDAQGWWTGRSNLIKAGLQGNDGANQIESTSNTQTTSKQVISITWSEGDRLRMYINGVENDSSDSPMGTAMNSIQEVLIGKGAKDNNTNEGWDGMIGEFIFYNQEFSADTIEEISTVLSEYSSIASGDWDDPNNWECDCVPEIDDKVTVEHTITLTGDVTISEVTINSGGILNVGSNTLTLGTNDLTVNGTFNGGTGAVVMSGGDAQSINGTGNIDFNDLDINNSSGVTINASLIELNGVLDLQQGELNTGGNLTLTSTSSQTGKITEIASGASITGDVTVQRYVQTSRRVWRYVSSPVSGTDVADWQNETPITGTFDNPSTGTGLISENPSLYRYDEDSTGAQTEGWANYPATGNSNAANIEVGVGYSLFVRDEPAITVLDLEGPVNTGDVSIPVSYTDTGNPSDDGWNLVGNPYPCPIDWDNVAASQRTGIGGAIYYIENDVDNPIIRTYIFGGIGIPSGTTGIIESTQGFWVKASSSPTFTLEEADKVSTNGAFYRKAKINDLLRVKVDQSNEVGDETVIRIHDQATDSFDIGYDAYKMLTSGINIYSKSDQYEKLAINTLNMALDTADTVSLLVEGINNNSFSLSFTEVDNLTASYDVTLIDKRDSTYYEIATDTSYQLVGDVSMIDRFELVFSRRLETSEEEQVEKDTTEMISEVVLPTPLEEEPPAFTDVIAGNEVFDNASHVDVYPNPSYQDFVHVKIINTNIGGTALIEVYNTLGEVIVSRIVSIDNEVSDHKIDVSEFNKGVYHITVKTPFSHFSEGLILH